MIKLREVLLEGVVRLWEIGGYGGGSGVDGYLYVSFVRVGLLCFVYCLILGI